MSSHTSKTNRRRSGAKKPPSPRSTRKNNSPSKDGIHGEQVKAALKNQEKHMRKQKKLERHNEIKRRAAAHRSSIPNSPNSPRRSVRRKSH